MDVTIPGPLAHVAAGPEWTSYPNVVNYKLLVSTHAHSASEISHR